MMTLVRSERVHDSAQIDRQAEVAPDVQIGPFAIIEGAVTIGPRCRIEPYARLRGPMTLGPDNVVGTHAALGTDPQSTSFHGEATRVEIGSGNDFGPFSTVHRGTLDGGGVTTIGDRNVFRSGAHVGHDVQIGDGGTFEENSLLAGHVVVGDGCHLGSHTAIQQRVRLGRLSRVVGPGASTKDVPPFFVLSGYNAIVGPNLVGMRRAGLAKAAIDALRLCHRALNEAGLTRSEALCRIDSEVGHLAEVRELIEFIRGSIIGINSARGESRKRYYA